MPVEPPPSRWRLDEVDTDRSSDLLAIGADLAPGTLLQAYRAGLFPMGLGDGGRPPYGLYSPLRRGILRAGDFHESRSLQRSRRGFTSTIDQAFDQVVAGCADPARSGGWITAEILAAYRKLYDLGWAHSVEIWRGDDLVGGLYGLAIGGLFAAESKFHTVTDASKAAVAVLSETMFGPETGSDAAVGGRLVDVQWRTPHLGTLGVHEVPRKDYFSLLKGALDASTPPGLRA